MMMMMMMMMMTWCMSRRIAMCMCLFSDCVEKQPSDAAQDDAVARRLWDVSVRLVHLDDYEIHETLQQSA